MQSYDNIFTSYYRLFRGESDVPTSTDEEYILGISLANNALNRWANYDGVYWKELYSTLQNTTQVSPTLVKTITTGTNTYACPTNMREPGGEVLIKDATGNIVRRYKTIESSQVQFQGDDSQYCYFTGDPTNGYTLTLNPTTDDSINGLNIDYVFYKKATEYSTGTDKSEIANPHFIVHNMLAQRYQIERNYGGYQIAKRDSEELLKNMFLDNNSGNWADSWSVTDNSGTVFGF